MVLDRPAEPPGGWLEAAEHLTDVADGDPRRALDVADRLAANAEAAGDMAAVVALLRAAGKAARVAGDVGGSAERLDRAVALADEHRLRALSAAARLTRAGTHSSTRPEDGLRDLDVAMPDLEPALVPVAMAQRGNILARMARMAAAEGLLDRAIPLLHDRRQTVDRAHALNSRGLIRVYSGRIAQGEVDIAEARDLYASRGLRDSEAAMSGNLGFAAMRRGDVLTAILRMEDAAGIRAAHGVRSGKAELDLGEVLLMVGIASEAAEVARSAGAWLTRAGDPVAAAEAGVLLATALLQLGKHAPAEEAAARAAAALRDSGCETLAQSADLVALAAAERLRPASRVQLEAALASWHHLTRAGQQRPALFAQLLAARIAARLGDTAMGEALLEEVGRSPALEAMDLRLAHATARALVATEAGQPTAALAAATDGLKLVERYRTMLGALELRAHVAGLVVDLQQIVLSSAAASGRPEAVWQAAEGGRARSLRYPPARQPQGELTGVLRDLREVTRQLESELEAQDRSALEDQRRSLERRATTLHRTAGPGTAAMPERSLADVADDLGAWVLVQYVAVDDELLAVVIDDGPRLVHLCPVDAALTPTEAAEFAIARLVSGAGTQRSTAVNRDRLTASLRRLDEVLVRPLQLGSEAGVVVVPPGALLRVPWLALPSLAGTPVVVCPTASLWRRPGTGAAPTAVLTAAGPGLSYAEPEASSVAGLHAGATALIGAAATVDRVLAAVRTVDLIHLAAHCRVVAENPLFSRIDLADGPLFVHDLVTIGRLPDTVVLSACSSVRAPLRPGDELLGFAGVLLGAGTRHLIGTLSPVADLPSTVDYMAAVHRGLAAGLAAPAALTAAARSPLTGDDPLAMASACLFTCYGVSG